MARTVKSKISKADNAAKSESLDFEGGVFLDEETKEPDVSFEDALLKLETIVKELEAGELTLENSLEKFAEGVSLSKMCLNKLNTAQAKIDKILREENGELTLKPFQPQEGWSE